MTHLQRIQAHLATRRGSGLCDDCLSEELGIRPRQAVNGICGKNEDSIHRSNGRCGGCGENRVLRSVEVGAGDAHKSHAVDRDEVRLPAVLRERDSNDEERLFNVGFQRLACWALKDGRLTYLAADGGEAHARLKTRAALYAFTSDRSVLYIGKTALTLAQRFAAYRSPGPTQSTNRHCNDLIRALLAEGKEVQILSLGGLTPLRWGEFELNIAAGLEDSLIEELTPPWNGGRRRPVTESEAIEREALSPEEANEIADPSTDLPVSTAKAIAAATVDDSTKSHNEFEIELGDTYYRQGIINPGSKAAACIGAHGQTMILRLGANDQRGIQTIINRRANSNGNPRLYGRRPVADWFQEHFNLGDTVAATVIGPHEIVLYEP